jgi:hypothetical protein
MNLKIYSMNEPDNLQYEWTWYFTVWMNLIIYSMNELDNLQYEWRVMEEKKPAKRFSVTQYSTRRSVKLTRRKPPKMANPLALVISRANSCTYNIKQK